MVIEINVTNTAVRRALANTPIIEHCMYIYIVCWGTQ